MSAYDPSFHAHNTQVPAPDMAADFLFITRKWAPAMGGMETWSMKIAEHLSAIRAIDWVALAGRENGMPPSALNLLLFPFTVLRHLIARSNRPKTLLLGDMALWPLALLAKRPDRILIAAHGTDVSYHRRGGVKGTFYGAYLRLGARLFAKATVIANSRATAEVAAETGWTNSTVIPLATTHHVLQPSAQQSSHILFAGRLVHRKGCGWFVREVLPHLPANIRLQIAGTGWDDSEAHVINHARVDYLGCLNTEQLAQAYADAICVIVPNIEPENGEYEGFGLVAPEAASAGGIVLAADHGGLRDAVINGETGRLLPTGKAPEWIDTITRIAAWSEEEQLVARQSAQRKSREFYNWDRVAAAIAELAASEHLVEDVYREASE